MAGNGHGDGVGGAVSGYGSAGLRHAELFGQGAVGAGFSAGDLLQGFPDLALKSGGANVQRQRGVGFVTLDEAGQAVSPLGQGSVIAAADGEGKFAPYSLFEVRVAI